MLHWHLGSRSQTPPILAQVDESILSGAVSEKLTTGRSLIAADGFYEWEKNGAAKQPWRITLKGGEAFAFAGLWERWEKAPDGVPVESRTIITTAANALVAKLHDRMPVILAPDDYPAWLGEDSASPPELLALLRPSPPDAMRAYAWGEARARGGVCAVMQQCRSQPRLGPSPESRRPTATTLPRLPRNPSP